METPWIFFNSLRIPLPNILLENPWQHPAINFCRDWLVGESEFRLQTSGSTGKPKMLVVHRDQLIASARLTNSYLNLSSGQTALVCLDARYIAGMMMLVRALEAKMNLYIVEPTVNPFENIPETEPIDFAALVPYQVEKILNSSDRCRFDQMQSVLIGGAALKEPLKDKLKSFRSAIYTTYGMTETLSHIALQRISGIHATDYFQTLPGISVSTDHRGCLVILAKHINPQPIITNDLVEMVAPGQFRWLGRFDSVINSGGIKIIPEKLEILIQALFDKEGITNRFFVAGTQDAKLGETVLLVVEKEILRPDELLLKLKEDLPKHQAPRQIRTLQKFVETNTGKINKPETLQLLHP